MVIGMAYLGIREKDDIADNGLYYFEATGVRGEIALNYTDPAFYTDKQKEKAMKEFGLKSEDEIRDGIELIRRYRGYGEKQEEAKSYLGVRGTPFDGVYEFDHVSARDKIAKKFADTYKSMDLEAILKEFGVDKSEVKNGGFLFGKEATAYAKEHKVVDNSQQTKKSEVSEKTETVKEGKKVSLLRDMISCVSSDYDVIEILMNEGSVYRLAYRDIFYLRNGVKLSNCASLDSDVNAVINASAIDKLIDNGDIIGITRSRINYHDGYTLCMNCDDLGSPTVRVDEMGRYELKHYYSKVVINNSAVSSVIGADTYRELAIEFTKITPATQRVVYDYLVKRARELEK